MEREREIKEGGRSECICVRYDGHMLMQPGSSCISTSYSPLYVLNTCDCHHCQLLYNSQEMSCVGKFL